jgi:hypothetical protein
MAKKEKDQAVTGANAQSATAVETKVAEKQQRQLGWHDYKKAQNIDILAPKGIRFITTYNKTTKRHTAYVIDVASGKWIGLIGCRKDGSDIYVKTELVAITAEERINTVVTV